MLSLNRVFIIGNLTRDPELRYTPNGQAVTSFAVATNRSWVDSNSGEKKDAVEYHEVVSWGKLAEICSQLLSKGRKVFVEGRLQTRAWEGQDGVKRQKTEIVAENVLVLDRPREGTAMGGSPVSPMMGMGSASTPVDMAPPITGDVNGGGEISLDDIPF